MSFEFTVITVCYNAERTIEKTIHSIMQQDFEDYEYWIVDGASSDKTIDIIKKYEPQFNGKLKWVSEKDEGIYDAMNKGIYLSKGKYIVFMNADDQMAKGSLKTLHNIIEKNMNIYDIIYGDSISLYENDGREVEKVKKALSKISLMSLRDGMGVVHQSMYTHRSVFERIGKFNLLYSIGADWDFLIRCVKNNVRMLYVEQPLSIFSTSGISAKNHHFQRHQIRKANGLYTFIDKHLIKDIMNLHNILQTFIGPQNFQKLRYWYNSRQVNNER